MRRSLEGGSQRGVFPGCFVSFAGMFPPAWRGMRGGCWWKRRKSLAKRTRSFFRWCWILGVIPVSHTWFLTPEMMETTFLPGYLALVFCVGPACFWWLQEHSLALALASVAVGWSFSLGLRLGAEFEGTVGWLSWGGAPWGFVVVAGWLGLGIFAWSRARMEAMTIVEFDPPATDGQFAK